MQVKVGLSMGDINLEEIIIGCKKSLPACQKQLYHYCFNSMMKICLRYNNNTDDAAACYNTAMYKVFSKINQYKGEGAFMGWVQKCVVNTCITEIKKRVKFDYKHVDDYKNDVVVPDVGNAIEAKEILLLVQQLPANYLLVFNMYVIEGYSHVEISKLLNISAGTSKWYLHEARNQLKEKIEQLYYNETKENERYF